MSQCHSAECCARHPRACARTFATHAPRLVSLKPSKLYRQTDTVNRNLLQKLAIDGELAVSHTNGANLPFARNWYSHMQKAGVHNFAIIATDDEAFDALNSELPKRVVPYPKPISAVRAQTEPLRYRSAGWTRLMFEVPRMVLWVLRMGLDVLWMDTDIAVFSNPFPVQSATLAHHHHPSLLARPVPACVSACVTAADQEHLVHRCSTR